MSSFPLREQAPDAIERGVRVDVSVGAIFTAFLTVGATSFGGGIVGHLRSALVGKRRWVSDNAFLKLLALSQTLPGLNATNLAILIGDRLHGLSGALAAFAGMCLPGASLMFVAGFLYQSERERPLVDAGLRGVSAAAVGLILATTLQLGRRSLSRVDDLVFVLLTVICVNRLDLPVPRVLIGVTILAVVWYWATGRRARPQ